MGNSSVKQHHYPSVATARVILWDGTVHSFDDPITVAELMLEHPQHVVVEFNASNMTGTIKRASPLPADRMLDVRKIYFMLPVKGGKPVSLSSDGARRVLSMANSIFLAPTASGFMPLLAKMCTAGAVDDEVVKKYDGAKLEDGMMVVPDAWCGEYWRRQVSGKEWKPSLDTIIEKKMESRVSHWLFS